MTERMHDLASEIIHLQGKLDRKTESGKKVLGVPLAERTGEFEHKVVVDRRRLKLSVGRCLVQSNFLTTITAPVIYSLIVPLILAGGEPRSSMPERCNAYLRPEQSRGC